MSPSTGRVFTCVSRVALNKGEFHYNTTTVRLSSVRALALSTQREARSKEPPDKDEPIKFSTSKASHRTWKVDHSMGSHYGRSWWKVLPISLFGTGLLLWCALREESDIDTQLFRPLDETLPSLLSDEDKTDKPS